MANFLSPHARRQRPVATAGAAGVTITQIFEYTVPATPPGATDIIEIGYLPANNKLLSFEVAGAATGTGITVQVALMTGEQGDHQDTTRALATPNILAPATAIHNASSSATRAACLAIPVSDKDVGIGIVPSAALTAAGKITVVATYMAGASA